MKILLNSLFMLIVLMTFTNVSYASFPVSNEQREENIHIEEYHNVSDKIESPLTNEGTYRNAIISFVLPFLGYSFIVLTIGAAFAGDLSFLIIFALFSIGSFISSIIFGIISIARKEKGLVLSVLGIILSFVGLLTLIAT